MANSPALWQKEYKQKGIPSSFRTNPSGTMKLLYQYLKSHKISLSNKIAVDLGCGTGRNSFSLVEHGVSQVYAIDFVQKLIREINKNAKKKGLQTRIRAICHDLSKKWPIPSNSLDLIIDIFVFKHQVNLDKQKFYKSEIIRTLKKNGFLLLSSADITDGYYGSQHKTKLKNEVVRITDPETHVDSLLYTKKSLLKEFEDNFKLVKFEKNTKKGKMHGKIYDRVTLKFLLQKVL